MRTIPFVCLALNAAQAQHATVSGKGYQIVGLVTWLNRIPAGNRVLRDYAVRARFRELVSGIPVVTEWTLTNTFHGNRPPFAQMGKVTGITWQTRGEGQSKTPRS
jgi:hypothetical protein